MLNKSVEVLTNPYLCNVFHFKDAFTKEECEKISAEYVNEKSRIKTRKYDNHFEISGSYMLEPSENSKWIYDRFEKYAFFCNNEYKFKISGISGMHILEYKENDILDWHIDILGSEAFSIRKISLAMYLSDKSEYEGGNIMFDIREGYDKNNIDIQQGSLVVFPSFLHHKVSKIKSGLRRSLVCKAYGPPFS